MPAATFLFNPKIVFLLFRNNPQVYYTWSVLPPLDLATVVLLNIKMSLEFFWKEVKSLSTIISYIVSAVCTGLSNRG